MRNENIDPEEFSDKPLRESTSPVVQFGWDFEGHRGQWLKVQRWLRSHVGQQWSEVKSKWTRRKKSGCQQEVHGNLEDRRFLEVNATKEGEAFYDSKGDEITDGFVVVDDILFEIKNDKPKYKTKTHDERRWDYGVVWKDNRVFALINHIWFELLIKEENDWRNHRRPYIQDLQRCDVFLENNLYNPRSITGRAIRDDKLRELLYGKSNMYCYTKRQINKQEIKNLKLREIGE